MSATPLPFRLQECTDDSTWDDFVTGSPQGNVFCRSWFLRCLPATVAKYFVHNHDQIVAAFVVLTRDGHVLPAPFTNTMYQGIMVSQDIAALSWHRRSVQEHRIASYVIATVQSLHGRVSFCLHPEWTDIRPFDWFNYGADPSMRFTLSIRYTGWLDLADLPPPADFLGQIRDCRRQEVHKARRAGCVIELSEDVEAFNTLHARTFERQGLQQSPEEERCLLAIGASALSGGFGELVVCRASGKVASATLILFDNRSGYYLYAANDPELRSSGASSFLMVECIERCRRRGLTRFDFVGVNSPQRGDFKQSFNARPVPYYLADWIAPPDVATRQ